MRAALIERGAPASGLAATSSTTAAARTAYELVWDCDMELTRAGVRGELVLEAAIADYGVVSLPVLAKVYNHSDTSAEHGARGWCWCFAHQLLQCSWRERHWSP